MIHAKLVHKNPMLNDKNLWYCRVDQMKESDWYYATIWGPNGMISSSIHAVPRSEYEIVVIEVKQPVEVSEFEMMRPVDSDSNDFV